MRMHDAIYNLYHKRDVRVITYRLINKLSAASIYIIA